VNTRDRLLLTLALLLPFALAACGSHTETATATTAGAPSPLEKTTWLLQAYGAADKPTSILAGTEVTATFGATAGKVTGSAGCNGYGGSYREAGTMLTVSDVIATKKFCSEPAGVMDQEQQYLNLLQAAERFQVTGRTLEIFTAEGKLLRFTAR
jgi:heat shock protein HslJ